MARSLRGRSNSYGVMSLIARRRPGKAAMIRASQLLVMATLGVVMMPMAFKAQSTEDPGLCDVATIQWDNDEMGGTDRHYTNGFRLACVTSPPQFLRGVIPEDRQRGTTMHRRATYSIGQSMFTPDDIGRSDPIEDDQPYAGWLYLGFGLESEVIPETDQPRYLDNFELQLGVVGPLSRAEQVQRIGHGLTNATDPLGWSNQLDNEPGINLFYSRQWTGAQEIPIVTGDRRLPRLILDVTPQLGAAFGNVHIFGASGLTLRLGSFLPNDHGPPVIRPSLSGSDFFPRQDKLSSYIFGSLDGRVVGRNIFLDGNSFDDDGPSVDKKTLVGEARLGLVVAFGDLRLTYTHTFRSREFEGQAPQVFGSLTLSLRL